MGRYYEHDKEIRSGLYPKIHDKLKSVIKIEDIRDKEILDVGGCSGAFGLWCLRQGARGVVVNDIRSDYLNLCKEYDKIHREMYGYKGSLVVDNQKISQESYFPYMVDTVIARRIIYELDDDFTRRRFVSQISHSAKVVYLQGLVRVKNHVRKLWNVELEAEMFYQYGYKLEFYNGNDIMVLRKD